MKKAGGVATFSSFVRAAFSKDYPGPRGIFCILIKSVCKKLVGNSNKQELFPSKASREYSLSVLSLA
jgi:hypothetical protein